MNITDSRGVLAGTNAAPSPIEETTKKQKSDYPYLPHLLTADAEIVAISQLTHFAKPFFNNLQHLLVLLRQFYLFHTSVSATKC